MLDITAPLYATYCLLKFIFLIVFSPHGLPSTASQITYEGAVLANNLLLSSCYCAIVFSLLFLSVNQQNWNVRGGTTQPCSLHLLPQFRDWIADNSHLSTHTQMYSAGLGTAQGVDAWWATTQYHWCQGNYATNPFIFSQCTHDFQARESMLRQQLADLEKAEQRSDVGPAGLSWYLLHSCCLRFISRRPA